MKRRLLDRDDDVKKLCIWLNRFVSVSEIIHSENWASTVNTKDLLASGQPQGNSTQTDTKKQKLIFRNPRGNKMPPAQLKRTETTFDHGPKVERRRNRYYTWSSSTNQKGREKGWNAGKPAQHAPKSKILKMEKGLENLRKCACSATAWGALGMGGYLGSSLGGPMG